MEGRDLSGEPWTERDVIARRYARQDGNKGLQMSRVRDRLRRLVISHQYCMIYERIRFVNIENLAHHLSMSKTVFFVMFPLTS